MNETTDATSIFVPLWRRKWLILAVGIVVGVGSYFYYKRQTPVYLASTQIFLGASLEEPVPGEKVVAKGQGASLADETAVINSIVVESVRAQLRKEGKISLARGTKVHAKSLSEKSEFITISAEAHSARAAAFVANATAVAYINRQASLHQRTIERAIAITRRQVRRIEAASVPKTSTSKSKTGGGSTNTATIIQVANLNSKINQLESSLAATGAQQVKPAKASTAEMLSPKPRKNAIFGFVLGIVLAAIAAYVLSRFDLRLRSIAGAENAYQAQVLAALPKVGRPVILRDGRPSPSKPLLEQLQRLHIALRLGGMRAGEQRTAGQVILVTSADAGDGKSSLVADLALVQRDAGERVAIVEANFRRPVQARLLGLEVGAGAHGLAAVLGGALTAADAMERVMPTHEASDPDSTQPVAAPAATAVEAHAGSLFVLAGGGPVANPSALLAHESMSNLLRSLAAEYDYVLVDAPSPLEVSDVLPLFGMVDGLVVIARVGHTREASARRLRQQLARDATKPVLGVVANCVAPRDSERSGFSAKSGRGWPGKLVGR